MRDDFSKKIKETLAKRVGYRCSNPHCRSATSGPQVDPTKTVNVGVASHISAASSGGPRFDESLATLQRNSIKNGIWLCQKCAKLIDNDTYRYSVDLLNKWKDDAEDKALSDVQSGKKQSNSKIDRFRKVLELVREQEVKAEILLKERYGDPISTELSPKFKGTSNYLSGFSFPLEDEEVKRWYFETISIFETGLGKTNDCLKKMVRLRKELLLFDGINCDPEFNTFDTGKFLIHSIDLLNDCIIQIERKIEILDRL
jgi:hypothetical protein